MLEVCAWDLEARFENEIGFSAIFFFFRGSEGELERKTKSSRKLDHTGKKRNSKNFLTSLNLSFAPSCEKELAPVLRGPARRLCSSLPVWPCSR